MIKPIKRKKKKPVLVDEVAGFPPYEWRALVARVKALEENMYMQQEQKTVVQPKSGASLPEPVIPLGYGLCALDEADKDVDGYATMLFYDGVWLFVDDGCVDKSAHAEGRELYLRCVLPPEIVKHWQPAPGATHEKQRKNAWPMGKRSANGRALFAAAMLQNNRGDIWHLTLDEFTDHSDAVPLVPRMGR